MRWSQIYTPTLRETRGRGCRQPPAAGQGRLRPAADGRPLFAAAPGRPGSRKDHRGVRRGDDAGSAARSSCPADHASRRDLAEVRSLGGDGRRDVPPQGPQGRGARAGHDARGDLHDTGTGAELLPGVAAALVPVPDQVPRRAAAQERPDPRPRVHHEGRLQFRRRPGRPGQGLRGEPRGVRADFRQRSASRPSPCRRPTAAWAAASVEFMCPTESGEDVVVQCPGCGYAANAEKATSALPASGGRLGLGRRSASTPPTRGTIERLVDAHGVPAERQIKTLVYVLDERLTLVLMRGDHGLVEQKLMDATGVATCGRPSPRRSRGAGRLAWEPGRGRRRGARRWSADEALRGRRAMSTGANEDGVHLRGVDVERRHRRRRWADLREVVAGEACPICGRPLDGVDTVEVGHIFKLGDKYTESLDVSVLGPDGERDHADHGQLRHRRRARDGRRRGGATRREGHPLAAVRRALRGRSSYCWPERRETTKIVEASTSTGADRSTGPGRP